MKTKDLLYYLKFTKIFYLSNITNMERKYFKNLPSRRLSNSRQQHALHVGRDAKHPGRIFVGIVDKFQPTNKKNDI
jgi:hypothetical protein